MLLLGVVAVALGGLYILSQQKGYIAFETPGVQLDLKGPFGGGKYVLSGSAPTAVFPRVYTPASLTVTREQDGQRWRLYSHGPWGELSQIRVERGRTTTIALGPPLLLRPEVHRGPGRVHIELGILGRAGEKYARLVREDKGKLWEPRMRIIDEAGTVLTSGRFEYG